MEQGGSDAKADQNVDDGTEAKLIWNFGNKIRGRILDTADPDKAYNVLTDGFHYELREIVK